ncbi:hypothetical protein K2173_014718 [Erythroxylum novogranatense]|uniref:Uncharacterized protein n=1 Tax=Erythroxylum novogranatense TaxID=1862640 RepID=A0AAV8TFC8_9ROSI|nr:hypothetical protein K2173_014718 [Erythroxylum novogranatense]
MVCDTQLIEDRDPSVEKHLQLMEGIEDQEVIRITKEGTTIPPIEHSDLGTGLGDSKDLTQLRPDKEIASMALAIEIQADPAEVKTIEGDEYASDVTQVQCVAYLLSK